LRSRKDIEQDKEDARMTKAWKKELKKDRKLSMLVHKKRELSLLD